MFDSRMTKRECYESGYADGSLAVTEEILQNQIPKWHLCKNELPEKQSDILLFLRSGEMSTGMLAYTDGYFYADCISTKYVDIENVIAWTELPKFESEE